MNSATEDRWKLVRYEALYAVPRSRCSRGGRRRPPLHRRRWLISLHVRRANVALLSGKSTPMAAPAMQAKSTADTNGERVRCSAGGEGESRTVTVAPTHTVAIASH